MRVGLIGNMNNNNFSLLRYFRDLGADAHLLLCTNDGLGSLSHFRPESDTWDMTPWSPYVHHTRIPNAPIAAFDAPISSLFHAKYRLSAWRYGNRDIVAPVTAQDVATTYASCDRLIGSGMSPATLLRAGRALDVFYPYSTGVEFYKTGEFLSRGQGLWGLNRWVISQVAKKQAAGIRRAKHVLNADMGMTDHVLRELGVEPVKLAIPMIYDREKLPLQAPSPVLKHAFDCISGSEFTLLHHARLSWRNPGQYSEQAWIKENKNNDAFIRAFAELVATRPALKPMLLLVEYGPDLDATQQLIAQLGIAPHVHWLPKMARRELMWLLSKVSVGVGEFYDVPRTIWGGTGWETLASGKPLLQGFQFAEGEFEAIYGHPPPPMLPVWSQQNILPHLLDMADHPERRDAIGQAAKAWFAEHNGIGLARKWLDLLLTTDRQSV